MSRGLGWALALYLPHLAEEYARGMYDDPIVALAYRPLTALPPRQGAYLLFQLMLVLALGMAFLVAQGGRGRAAVEALLAVALLAETHHLLRALFTGHANPGLWTAAPMPVLGVVTLRRLWIEHRATAAS